jgi:hypothetical protein
MFFCGCIFLLLISMILSHMQRQMTIELQDKYINWESISDKEKEDTKYEAFKSKKCEKLSLQISLMSYISFLFM